MTTTQLYPRPSTQDRFGRQVAARLAAGTAETAPRHHRAPAGRPGAGRRPPQAGPCCSPPPPWSHPAAPPPGASATAGQSLWNRIASALPLIALAAGLILIHAIENDRRASEVAEVDAALLTDDLPPSAYADPGFVQFLKSGD